MLAEYFSGLKLAQAIASVLAALRFVLMDTALPAPQEAKQI
jgi:hypothetical protein